MIFASKTARQLKNYEKQMLDAVINNNYDLFYNIQKERLFLQVSNLVKNHVADNIEGKISMKIYENKNSDEQQRDLRILLFKVFQCSNKKISKESERELLKYEYQDIAKFMAENMILEAIKGVNLIVF